MKEKQAGGIAAQNCGYDSCPPMNVAKQFNEADVKSGLLRNNKKSDRAKAFPLGGKVK